MSTFNSPTMQRHRANGDTTTHRGVELVHGRVLVREEYERYMALESERQYLLDTVSPFRSDYKDIMRSIEDDMADSASALVNYVHHWLEDDAAERRVKA